MKILLVAGHGDGDTGACGNGFIEATLTREVIKGLADKLRHSSDVTVFDINKNLYKYQKKNGDMNFKGYDLVFEVHFNAGGGRGVEMLRHKNTYTKAVDNNVILELAELGFKNRGVKTRSNLQNMNICCRQGVPYSLLEVCFIDSSEDMKIFADKKEEIISKIAKGIMEAYGIEKGDDEMTTDEKKRFETLENEVKALKENKEKIYHYFNELPDWAYDTVKKLYDRGIYKGNSANDLNLPETLMRVLVINDRAGIYK